MILFSSSPPVHHASLLIIVLTLPVAFFLFILEKKSVFVIFVTTMNKIRTAITKLFDKTIIRYILWGATAAMIDLFFLSFFTEFLGLYYLVSQTLSFCIAFVYAYLFQKYITFRNNSKQHLTQWAKFLIFQLIWLWINLILLHRVVQYLWWHYIVGSIFAKGVVFFRNFSMNKWFNFS